MRTTVNIDDALLERLRKESQRSKTSLTATINRLLRKGLERSRPARRSSYQETTYDMGIPSGVNLVKALQLAAMLEDEEILRKLELGK